MPTTTPFADFDSIVPGARVQLRKLFTAAEVDTFARLSGDRNPLHVDESFAARTTFGKRVAHGMLSAAYVSTLVGMHMPGPGALWMQQSFDFLAPVFIGDEIDFQLTVEHKSAATRMLQVRVEAVNQRGKRVMEGNGKIMVLEETRPPATTKNERLALVTGSSRGIGAAIAEALARQGIGVVVNYRASARLGDAVVERLMAHEVPALAVQADVTDAAAVSAMIARAEDTLGRGIDILVNNATGSNKTQPFLETAWQDFDAHWDIHVKGAYHCCRAVLPGMIARGGGCIINLGSIATWGVPPLHMTPYAVAKSGLRTLTQSLAAEFGPRGIRANMVSPGMTATDLTADIPERARKVLAMQTPLRRLAVPEDTAAVVAMLCSEAGNFINGADIPVCGGIAM